MESKNQSTSGKLASGGISAFNVLGMILAAIISYQLQPNDLFWTGFHAYFSWFYIIGRVLFCGGW